MKNSYFITRERELLQDSFDEMYRAPQSVFRGATVNGLRMQCDTFAKASPFAVAPSPFCSNAFLLQDETVRPGHTAWHHAGAFYVQEPSASVPATLLQVQKGDRVLDLCAAPGGKTSQLAAALQGTGLLVANEYVAARATILKGNLERMGVSNALILNETTQRIAKAFPGFFDKILVDAPCSGEGMFRKESQAVEQHSEALVLQCASLGSEILDHAAQCLAQGGMLVYSTCTFAPQEDEQQVGAFLERHPEFELIPCHLTIGSAGEQNRAMPYEYPVEYTRRIYPCHGGEGHFMAVLRKKGEQAATRAEKSARTKPMPPLCKTFLQTHFPMLCDKKCMVVNDTIYLVPDELYLPDKLRVVQAGVQIGTVQKNRFVPAHHLFMVWGAQCTNKESLTQADPRVGAWLHGEEIEATTAKNGYTAILCDGYPLGFGKCSNGRIKNHYPKGLRNLK